MRKSGIREENDERILGSGEFVSKVIEQAAEKIKHQLPAIELKKSVMSEIKKYCRDAKMKPAMLKSGSRRPPLPELRRKITLKLINEYGVSFAETARQIGISTSGVAQIIKQSKST